MTFNRRLLQSIRLDDTIYFGK